MIHFSFLYVHIIKVEGRKTKAGKVRRSLSAGKEQQTDKAGDDLKAVSGKARKSRSASKDKISDSSGEDDGKKTKKTKVKISDQQGDPGEENSNLKKKKRIMSRRIPPISPPRKLGEVAKQDATDDGIYVCHCSVSC